MLSAPLLMAASACNALSAGSKTLRGVRLDEGDVGDATTKKLKRQREVDLNLQRVDAEENLVFSAREVATGEVQEKSDERVNG